MKSEISKKSDRETGRFIGTLLMVLLLIAAVTTISVTLGAIHVSPDEIVKILIYRSLYPVVILCYKFIKGHIVQSTICF